MKNAALVLSSLSLVGVLVLFGIYFSHQKESAGSKTSTTQAASTSPAGSSKLAYVNIDSFESGYTVMKTKQEEFKKRQEQMESELQRSYQQMQNDAAEVQKKAQANTLTQAEYNSAEKRLMQMQQSLENRKQTLSEQLLKERDDFNKSLKAGLDSFFEEYNKDRRYDFIFYYSPSGSSLLYVNKALDITNEVINGMNERAKNSQKEK
jgi:outer membrane protein